MKKKDIIAKILFVITLLAIWEFVSKNHLLGPRSELIFPSLEKIMQAFVSNFTKGYAGISLWTYVINSLKLLLKGLVIGILGAFILSGLATLSHTLASIFNLLISVFDLLPGVALLPVIIIVLGVNSDVIVFLVIHSVLWPMSRSILDGFMAVPKIYVEAGNNIGLKNLSLILGVYFPASISYLLSGLKVGWARAWRGLISAEMIFGIASCPGIGLYINQMRTNMNNAEMYATLIVIIIIGVIVQYGVLAPIEKNTVKKWGMSS
ncbi:NitT/TauT family transport system permease protein [Lachnospiraceae bacterium XBB2008]|nr:NitT/TauT family transport system permease protein [Lachnospiraceae bacterium XBB2008]